MHIKTNTQNSIFVPIQLGQYRTSDVLYLTVGLKKVDADIRGWEDAGSIVGGGDNESAVGFFSSEAT